MSSVWGSKIKIAIFGQSHSEGLGVVIDGLPAGQRIDLDRVNAFLQRRSGGKNSYSTKRNEKDEPKILSGLVDNITCGAPLCAIFENADIRSKDYEALRDIPRPSHADFTAGLKHGGFEDKRGGGHFSGRLTLPICFAGAICLQLLEREGVSIGGHIYAIGDVYDRPFDLVNITADELKVSGFPALDSDAASRMIHLIEGTANQSDSIGGVVECAAIGFPAGLGGPIFDNIESRLASMLFSIPAVKGVEFGAGFSGSKMNGSRYNDAFYFDGETVKTKTNNCGGILGGISNGMPIVFRTAFKPTPSILKPQETVNLKTRENISLEIAGRHDPCIVPRAVPVVEAACAITLLDILIGG